MFFPESKPDKMTIWQGVLPRWAYSDREWVDILTAGIVRDHYPVEIDRPTESQFAEALRAIKKG